MHPACAAAFLWTGEMLEERDRQEGKTVPQAEEHTFMWLCLLSLGHGICLPQASWA